MNKTIDNNQQSGTNVQFASDIVVCKGISQTIKDIGSAESNNSNDNKAAPSSSSSFRRYTSKELKAFRRDIFYSIDANKAARKQKQATTTGSTCPTTTTTTTTTTTATTATNETPTCLQGLEIFSSDVQRGIQKNYATKCGTNTPRRVQFASDIVVCKGISQTIKYIGSAESNNSDDKKTAAPSSSSSSRWYTSKELKAFRKDIFYSIDADKAARKGKQATTTSSTCPIRTTTAAAAAAAAATNETTTCMRGLEIFSSDVRRDLQKHYAKSVIEAQRRIKKRKRSIRGEDDDILLQQVASRYSKYARDRAYDIALRDECVARGSQD